MSRSAAGLQAALSALTGQILELDAILASDPGNAEIAALRQSIQAEADLFEQDAVELRKRQLLSAYADNASDSSTDEDDSEPEVPLPGVDDGDEKEPVAAVAESAKFRRPEPISNDFCSWMNHTKGIGLRLLQKHGYVFGAGLGKRQQGRVEPVDIVLRKPKAGLDFGAKPKKIVMPKAAVASDADPKPDVFDFLNARLNRPRARAVTTTRPDLMSEHDCQKSLLHLGEAIAANASERDRVAAALNRCVQQKNDAMIKHYSARLQQIDGSLNQLQTMHHAAANTRKKQRSSMKLFKF